MGTFTFNGVTIVAPGFILKSTIGANNILNLLPFGKLLFVGTSDGGQGNGTIYEFTDLNTAKQVLRGGALLDAFLLAGAVGGASSFAACVAGAKSSAHGALTGADSSAGTFTAGDQGTWTNQIAYSIAAGSSSGFAATFKWPDENGDIIMYGGPGSLAFDNLASQSALAAAIAADPLLTPPKSVGFPAVLSLVVTTDGVPDNSSGFVNLSGGTGSGEAISATVAASPAPAATGCTLSNTTNVKVGTVLKFLSAPFTKTVLTVNHTTNAVTYATGATATAGDPVHNIVSTDFITALNECVDEPFDIGCLINGYDNVSQAYADELSMEVYPLGRLSRWIHQIQPSGLSVNNTKAQNSTIIVNAGTGAAEALDCQRSSLVAQRANVLNPATGVQELVDLAPIMCGYMALIGATGANGPATAATQDTIPTVISLDYPILGTNNTFIVPSGSDLDRAILGGLMPFVNLSPTGVRCVQSITTAPADATGAPWIYAEFSVQRVVDAVQANVKAAIESMNPKGLGAGATSKTTGHIIATVIDVLDAALTAQWITAYNKSAVAITPAVQPTDAIVNWDMAPVFPLNHLGLNQTVQPFSVTVQQQTGG